VSARWNSVAGRSECAHPFARARATGAEHNQHVGLASGKDVEDVREGQQHSAYFVNPLAGIHDMKGMGLHG
jgi:hypothetical protein